MFFDKKLEQESRMKEILSNMDEENMKCADCGNESIDYASINNGIIICFSCYQKHKILGNHISYLIAIGDKWDNYLIKYISSGGNSRFKQFCKDYHIDNMDILNKYKTRASEYYREIIRSEVMGFEPPNNIDVVSASQILNDIPNNYPEFEGYTSVKQIDMNALEKKYPKKKNNKVMSSISGFFSSFTKKVNDAAENFVGKVSELKDNNTFINNCYNKANNLANNIAGDVFGKKNSSQENVQNINNNINGNNINSGTISDNKNINENLISNKEDNINKNKQMLNSNDNKTQIYIDNEEINKIIKEAQEAQKENIKKEEEKAQAHEDLNNETKKINTDDIKGNEDINKKNEKNNEYGLDDNDELLKKIAEIEGSN